MGRGKYNLEMVVVLLGMLSKMHEKERKVYEIEILMVLPRKGIERQLLTLKKSQNICGFFSPACLFEVVLMGCNRLASLVLSFPPS